jgi:hypothetical protein
VGDGTDSKRIVAGLANDAGFQPLDGQPHRRGRFQGLAIARETSNVCVDPEKERERMKSSLSNIEGLSAEIEN